MNQVVVRGTPEWSPSEGPLIQIIGIEGVAVKSELPPEYLAMYPHMYCPEPGSQTVVIRMSPEVMLIVPPDPRPTPKKTFGELVRVMQKCRDNLRQVSAASERRAKEKQQKWLSKGPIEVRI